MSNRFLVRSVSGDHIAQNEAEILDWLRRGHCGSGDFVYSERDGVWTAVCDLPLIAPLFAAKPTVKHEKPVITVYRLGQGKSLQAGPFTLSTVLEMLYNAELCASSWIFVEGDKEWRQVKNVKVLRDSLRATPRDIPQFNLRVAEAAGVAATRALPVAAPMAMAVPDDLPMAALQGGLNQETLAPRAAPPGIPENTPAEMTRQSQPSIVPLPAGVATQINIPEGPTATLTINQTRETASVFPDAQLQPKVEFVPIPEAIPIVPAAVVAPQLPVAPPSAPPMEREEISVRLDRGSPPPAPPASTGNTKKIPVPNAAPPPPIAKAPAPPVPPPMASAPAAPPRPPTAPFDVDADEVPEEEQTKAFSKLGLAQVPSDAPGTPPPPPSGKTKPIRPLMTQENLGAIKPADSQKEEPFDGITVEISPDPIWMVKQGESERVSGPYTFQQIVDLLSTKRLSKEDKVSKVGTNRFSKISQQFEFNVKYSLETVVEGGVERQKILVKRRHPRVAYITDVHISKIGRSWLAKCINISAGGVLLESSELEINLGETVELVIMQALIQRKIVVSAQLIGKIPKKPPGYAFRFTNLSREDKEEIEFFVVEAMKKEKAMGM